MFMATGAPDNRIQRILQLRVLDTTKAQVRYHCDPDKEQTRINRYFLVELTCCTAPS